MPPRRHSIRQAPHLFKLLACNGGVKGQGPLRSLGGTRGPFSHVREWPPFPCSAFDAAILLMLIDPPVVEREDTLAEFARFERREHFAVDLHAAVDLVDE